MQLGLADRRSALRFFILFILPPFFLAPACRQKASAKPSLNPPTGLTATAVTTMRIDLAWVNVSPDATAIEVERSTDGGVTWTLIATLPASQTSYSDTGLAPSTEYCYRVRVTQGTDTGPYSPVVCVNTVVVSSMATTGGPISARMGHSTIFDPTGNRILVFGGLTGTGVVKELWALDLATNTWSQPATTGTPPSARWGHSAILDSGNNQMVIFGGNDGTPPGNLNDLYSLNLSTLAWGSLAATGGPPLPRHDHTAIYDALFKRMILFDGTDNLGPFDEVWSLDLSASPNTWTQFTVSGPQARSHHSAVYDAVNQRMIIFGGQDTSAPGTFFPDAWALSLPDPKGAVNPAWSSISATGGPTARFGHSAILNGSKMMVFGGYNTAALGEMWQLNLGASPSWSMVILGSPAPGARLEHRVIFVAATTTMVLFGGGSAPSTPAFNDVWQFGM